MRNPAIAFYLSAVLTASLFAAHFVSADIVGGEEVKNPSDPTRKSIAALYEPSRNGAGGALCTASLIGPSTAVTAAHCLDPQGPAPVMIFGNNIRSNLTERRQIGIFNAIPRLGWGS